MTEDHQHKPGDHTLWRTTVGYIVDGRWRELLDHLDTTTPDYVMGAVCYGLDYSPHDAKQGRGYLSTVDARGIMTALGAWEPADHRAVICALLSPSPYLQAGGKVHWPINSHFITEPANKVWSRIFGIEAEWMAHDRAGFLAWTELGRDRYAAGESATFVETSRQTAFAF